MHIAIWSNALRIWSNAP